MDPFVIKLLKIALFSFIIGIAAAAEFDSQIYPEYCEENCCCHSKYIPNKYPHRIFVGPEFYHIHRSRGSGAKQNGWIYGVRAGYERVKRFKIYWGADFLYGEGQLHGKSDTAGKLKSTFRDENIEGRLGYTFQKKCSNHLSLTPYVGYGYFRETNRYHENQPRKVKFRTTFDYVVCGFLSNIAIFQSWNAGVNFKARFPLDGRCKIFDPEENNSKQLFNSRWQYRVELPISYRICQCYERVELDFVPFYEFRRYGGRENYPFNFIDTRLKIYGVNLQFSYRI